jgi:ornithine racemase
LTTPRLEIDLVKIHSNAEFLVKILGRRGISVSAVTKATLGLPSVAKALLAAGVSGLADSRIENILKLRHAKVTAPITLIRSPMISQAELIVKNTDISLNTELDIISALSKAAQTLGRPHGVLLMVELGDLREGIMPAELEAIVRRTLDFPNITLKGIGTNLACRSGVAPDTENMAELSALANAVESTFDLALPIVSGGNSSNLNWALAGSDMGRINNLRVGEAILLGCEPLHRQPIKGLYTDAITLVSEVIESKIKPSQPWGKIGENAFGATIQTRDRGCVSQAIFALGHMDTDPQGLTAPPGLKILGSSSDHVIVDTGRSLLPIGAEVTFQLNYSALVRAMASTFVAKHALTKGKAMVY